MKASRRGVAAGAKRILLSSLLGGLALAACAWLGRSGPAPLPFRVWPLPPDTPRVELLMSFASPDDLGFPRKFWRQVARILFGTGPDKMGRPYAVAVRKNMAAVTDTRLGAVHVYDFENKEYRRFGGGRDGLVSPVGVAFDHASRIWVTDSVRAEVRIYRPNGKLEKRIHPFERPTGITYDETRGVMWVADSVRHKLFQLDSDGNLLGSNGGRGGAPGEFNFPVHLAFQGNRLLVADTINFRIQILTPEGKAAGGFGHQGDGSGDLAMPKGVGTDSEGHVYVADALFDAFQIFEPSGAFLLSVGRSGPAPGDFSMPTGLFVDEQDRIWVADSQNGRVQVFQYLREGRAPTGPLSFRKETGFTWLRSAFAVGDVSVTVHNLATSGPGPTKSTIIDQPCVFCHTPHNSQPKRPLWNRTDSGATYTPLYGSSTLNATVAQPTGSSKLCLACHDGTVALGSITNAPTGQTPDLGATFVTGRASMSTGLGDDHPIGFTYDAALVVADPQLRDPATLTGVVLESGKLECGTCHESHDNTNPPFLRVSTANGDLCARCHNKTDWTTSAHSASVKTWNGLGTDPWGERKTAWRQATVAGNSCLNCHDPHSAANATRLLKQAGDEENTCYPCHNANVAAKNVQNEFAKTYRHGLAAYSGVHNPVEDPLTMASHVECADCHDPHVVDGTAFTASPYGAPLGVGGRLKSLKGVNTNGLAVEPSTYLYEVCYKCHGVSNAHTPNFSSVVRRDATYNLRLKFETTNPSYHPVEAAGKNANVPSLLAPFNTGSLISCLDCHNNDASPWVSGAGPNGPHGSIYGPGIFMRNYLLSAPIAAYNAANFTLCYRCHNSASIMGNQSFAFHSYHLQSAGNKTTCMVCHDPHGSTQNNHLINFMKVSRTGTALVVAGGGGGCAPYPEPTFIDNGFEAGTCYLKCHGAGGVVHCPFSYP